MHRLVAEAFIRPISDGEIVHHKDNVPTNNRVENIEICDGSGNALHSLALRSKISRFEVIFIPLENRSHKGLFISLGRKRDEDLFSFLQSKGFRCLHCDDRMKARILMENYFAS